MTFGESFPSVLAAAQAGADWAYRALYENLAPPVLGYLRGQGARDPEDLTSEVFVGVVRNIDSFEGDERSFRTWVFAIAHKRLVDERRRHSRRPEQLTDPAAFEPLIEEIGETVEPELHSGLPGPAAEALLKLSPDQRAVVLLRIVADLSVSEVARILGKNEGAVKTLTRRALERLAAELEGGGVS